ncbi:MAG: hypothetical protein SOS24_00510 [Clostridia bacterium]|nr:hypothetical protein [Clostridia bacterium]
MPKKKQAAYRRPMSVAVHNTFAVKNLLRPPSAKPIAQNTSPFKSSKTIAYFFIIRHRK